MKDRIENIERKVDYADGPRDRFGIFLNKITFPNGKIKPLPALIGLYIALGIGEILSLGLLLGLSEFKDSTEKNGKLESYISSTYQNPTINPPLIIKWYDLNKDAIIDSTEFIYRK